MSKYNCRICGKSSDIFMLTFEPWETDADQEWSVPICGTCWEIIAAVARRAVKEKPPVDQDEKLASTEEKQLVIGKALVAQAEALTRIADNFEKITSDDEGDNLFWIHVAQP